MSLIKACLHDLCPLYCRLQLLVKGDSFTLDDRRPCCAPRLSHRLDAFEGWCANASELAELLALQCEHEFALTTAFNTMHPARCEVGEAVVSSLQASLEAQVQAQDPSLLDATQASQKVDRKTFLRRRQLRTSALQVQVMSLSLLPS